MTLQEYFTEHPDVADLWDAEKNIGLSPSLLTMGSHKKIWCRCKQGHNWQLPVFSFSSNVPHCPYCSGRRVIPGETDLQTRYPDVAALWDTEKNKGLSPTEVSPGSHKKAWWKCSSSHSWESPIFSLTTGGCRCPYCAGKKVLPGKTDLSTLLPELSKEWCEELNGPLTPDLVSCGQKKQVWWRCEKGHTWQAYLFSRTKAHGAKCPYCTGKKVLPGFNDLETLRPALAQEWHPSLNNELTPDSVTVGSNKQVWWQCKEGHTWRAAIYSRTRAKASGCPVCAGRTNPKQIQYPQIAQHHSSTKRTHSDLLQTGA